MEMIPWLKNNHRANQILLDISSSWQTKPSHEMTVHGLRVAAACLALLGTVFPWLWFDGAVSPEKGTDLIAYVLTGNERWHMIKTSFVGAFFLFTMPLALVVLNTAVAIKIIRGDTPWAGHACVILLPLITLMFARNIISSDHPSIGALPVPGFGLSLMILMHLTLIGHSLWIWKFSNRS